LENKVSRLHTKQIIIEILKITETVLMEEKEDHVPSESEMETSNLNKERELSMEAIGRKLMEAVISFSRSEEMRKEDDVLAILNVLIAMGTT